VRLEFTGAAYANLTNKA